MGIDYILFSRKKPDAFEYLDPNQFMKHAIADIEWRKIFSLLRLDLDILYDNIIDYWCPEQINDMYDMIRLLAVDPHKCLYDGWERDQLEPHMVKRIDEALALKTDISKLAEYFKYLVDNELYIKVV